MKFDITKIHTIYESTDEDNKVVTPVDDETCENIEDAIDNINAISDEIFAAMKDAASDPSNLKITMVKDETDDTTKMYIEAVEFMTFCEACGCNEGEAVENIIDNYKEEIPELDNAEFHVVFPNDALNKNVLGGENMGRSIKNDYPVKMLSGLRRYGIKVDVGPEPAPVDEAKTFNSEDLKKRLDDAVDKEKTKEAIETIVGRKIYEDDKDKEK